MKKIVIILLALIISIIPANASEINLETMSRAECNNIITKITNDILESNEDSLITSKEYIEDAAYRSMYNFIENHTNKYTISERLIEFTYPENSDTGDDVIMVNCKVPIENKYNIIYLFEFHVNKGGKIYGCNIWQY